jgi:competence protein ComEC
MKFFQNLRPSEQLRWCLLCFIIGIFLPLELLIYESLLLSGLLFVATFLFQKFWIILLAILVFSAGLSGWRGEFDFRNDVLVLQKGQMVEISGMVRTPPDVRENSVRAFVTSEKGDFLLILPSTESLHYGDEIYLYGKVTIPRDFGEFNYRRYLRRWGAQTIIKNPKTFKQYASGGGNMFVRIAQGLRTFLEKNVRRSLPEPHATIAVGVILGVKSSLPEWTQNDFKNSGLQHLLVVSGSNVAIVLALVAMLLARFGRRAVLCGSLLALGFFVLIVGPDAPVIRAAVMGGVVGVAAALGRFSDARTLVLLSACIIGIFQPSIIRDDVGFHLSFAATIGIIVGTPILLHFCSKISKTKYWKVLSLILSVSFAAQIAVLPILGRSFGTFPVAGVLANIFAEPLVPLAMGSGTVCAMFGWLPLFWARALAIPAFIAIEVLLLVARVFGRIQQIPIDSWVTFSASILIGGFALWGLLSRSFAEKWLLRLEEK